MARSSLAERRFLRVLAGGGAAREEEGGRYVATGAAGTARLDADAVAALESAGLLARTGGRLAAGPEARAFLSRAAGGPAPFRDQHKTLVRRADGTLLDLAESPLMRLAVVGEGATPFLAPHQAEAGECVRRLAERAQMVQRTTMSYDPARSAGAPVRNGAGMVADGALDARRRLGDLLAAMPRDCAEVVLDVCGLLKGLQTVETERRWPARSAKLVLRIGLDHAARLLGLAPEARGPEGGRSRGWLAERPSRFE